MKLEKIIKKYSDNTYNKDNYEIGGGLTSYKCASNRHENALNDKGKLTFGKVCQIFKGATECNLDVVKDVINYAVPNMEWHHAGFLPKTYGGGMKKTYFLNSCEIVMIAKNWDSYLEKLEISKETKRKSDENAKSKAEIQHNFLQKYGVRIIREQNTPIYFYETECEMSGKYGWFSAYGKSYNMTKYYTGWSFETLEKLNEFLTI